MRSKGDWPGSRKFEGGRPRSPGTHMAPPQWAELCCAGRAGRSLTLGDQSWRVIAAGGWEER